MQTKHNLRQKLRIARKDDGASALITKNVQHLIDHLPSMNIGYPMPIIGLYNPMSHEPNVDLQVNFKQLFTHPQIIEHEMEFVFFFVYTDSESIISQQIVTPDLLIIPGIAFDIRGYRLGLGKGHYDRYLSKNNKSKTIGVCFSDNLLERLPNEPHDCKMDYIVTEHSIIKI